MNKENLISQKEANAIKAKEILTADEPNIEEAEKLIEANKTLDNQIKLLEQVENVPVDKVEQKSTKVEVKTMNYINDIPFRGDRQEKELKAYTFGKYMQASLFNNQEAKAWLKENGHFKANGEATSGSGGILTPDIVTPDLIWLRNEYGIMEKFARKVQMGSDYQVVPSLITDGTAVWATENTNTTAYDLGFSSVALTAKKLMVFNAFSTELREDALIDYAAAAAKSLMYSTAKELDRVFFQGKSSLAADGNINGLFNTIYTLDGTLANIASLELAPVGSIGTPANLTIATFRNMVKKLATYAYDAAWYCSKSFFYTRMAPLGDVLSGNAIGDYATYWTANPMFLGYPVRFVENLPGDLVANTPVCCLADLSKSCIIGDRASVDIAQYDQPLAAADSILIRSRTRVGFGVADPGNASGTASARVGGSAIVLAAQAT